MITLAADCLVFEFASGESIPILPDMMSVDLMGETAKSFDPDFVGHAAKAVFHYFKYDQKRRTVSVGEFAAALEGVLSGFGAAAQGAEEDNPAEDVEGSDLAWLARESRAGGELLFFPRLRQQVRQHARRSPGLVRFHGLRDCVKELLGARRWGGRCRTLEEQILAYMRKCLTADMRSGTCSLMVC